MLRQIYTNPKIIIPVGMVCGLVLFLMNTNPKQLPIAWLLAPFLWIFMTLFYVFRQGFVTLLENDSTKRVRVLAVIAAVLPVIVLLLSSVNELTIRDLMLLSAVGAIGLLYTSRFDLS